MAYRQSDSQRRNDVVRYDVVERIGVLSKRDNGWTREVNIVSWNNGAAKVDIREWDPDHKRMTKGVTLFEEEAETLTRLLARRYGLRLTENEPVHRAFTGGESGRSFFRDDRSPGTASGRLADSDAAKSFDDPAELPEGETAQAGSAFETERAGGSAGEAAEAAAGQYDGSGAAPAAEAAASDFTQAAAAPAGEAEACVAESSLYLN